MVFAMMFGISATTISAVEWTHADHDHSNENDEIYYVSLGDSMSNGYCFDGYIQSDIPAGEFVNGNGGYGKAAYPNVFAKWLADTYGVDVHHAQLAVSAMRAEDLLYFLGGRDMPTDGWTDEVNSYTDEYDDEVLSEYIVDSITNADIISMGIGNASFGAYLLHRVTDALGIFGASLDEDEKVTLEQALVGLDEEQKEVILEIYNEAMTELLAYIPENIEEYGLKNVEDIANLMAYVSAGFILNYAGVVDRIVELNPDVELILVGLMNTTYGMTVTVEGMDPIPVGDVMDTVFDALNAYVAAYPVAKQVSGEFEEAEFYYSDVESIEFISQKFDDLKDADWAIVDGLDGKVVRTRNIKAYNDSLREALGSAFGVDLQKITLADVEAYEAAIANGETLYVVNFDQYWNVTGYNKNLSVAVYLGIEDAVAESCEITEIPLDGLVTIATDLFSVFGDLNIDFSDPVAENLHATLANYLTSTDMLKGMCKIYALFKVGNGMSVHPTPAAHAEIAEKVIEAYDKGYTAEDETINNALIAAGIIADLVVEYHDEAFAYAHAELRANGTIDEINAALDAAIEAVEAAREAAEALEVTAEFAESKTLLVSELALTEATLAQIKVLVNIETLSQEHLDTLETLLGLLVDHLETIGELSAELAGIGLTHLNAALMEAVAYLKEVVEATVEELKVLVNELTARAYAYIVEMAPVAYEKFVNAVVEAVKYYSHEAAKACYYWLLNNPETVIGFFDQYGDDIVDVIVENYEIVFGVLGFVGATYGDEIVELVLNNADVIFPAIVYWFEIHGDLVWDLVVVYFNAIVEYYELGIDFDFSTPEGILDGLNNAVGLLGELLDMIVDGVYDYIEALGIVEKIEAELAKLDAYIRETVTEQIETIKAIVEAKIEEIKAEINAKIEALEKALEDATEEAKEALKAEIEALKAELEALVNAEIENLEDAVAALKVLVKNGVKDLGELIAEAVLNFVDEAVRGEFTPTEDTYYVSVNGGDAYYAELLAGALSENLESPIKVGATTWDNLDYEMLAKADLVTIGYDENELSGFAVNQLLAYVANYVDVDLRTSTNEYIVEVFAALNKALHEIVDGKFNVPFDFDDYKGEVLDGLNGTIDEVLSYELIAGREIADMDWAKYVGEENLHYVDEVRAALRAELVENGVIESYTYTVDVVDYLYANGEELGIAEVLNYINKNYAYEVLGENAYYTVEVPVADAIVFAAESYLYGNVEFNYNYGKLIVDLYKMNPEATVILLGHYNAYDVELALGDVTVDLGEAYGIVAGVASVHPFGYALVSPNVAYVDIYEAETVYESYVAAGLAEGTVLEFLMMYLADSSITDVSEAGNVYIYEQILNILTVGCDHKYDNGCDETCNKCGAVREVAGHVYDNACDADCNECGEIREVGDHEYDENGECIHCGASQTTPPVIPEDPKPDPECLAGNHYFDDCDDRTCYKCSYVREELPAHEYDDCEDVSCNKCGKERAAVAHVYDNACDAECNRCGADREAADHVYSGCTDTNCNVCGAERSDAKAHVVDDCEDTICNVCGQNVAAEGHKYGEWTVTEEASRKNAGKKVHVCTVCNHEEIKAIAALGGIGAGAIVAIVVGSVVVAGAAGFAIYWFLIQKKTFADLLALINKPAAGAEAPAAETPEAEAETPAEEVPAEEAPAAEEETK